MDYATQVTIRNEMTTAISTRIHDPAGWLYAVRRIAERLDLRVERFLPIAGVTLETACAATIDEAAKQSRAPERVRAALHDWCGYHPVPNDHDRRGTIA